MAIKATCSVTLSAYRDTESITRYYKLQSSTATAPTKPTTNPPSGWTDTEPSYTSGSTNSLYFCDLTVFSDGTWAYSNVSKSSSYEAAKEAYNKAQNAQNTADEAKKFVDNAASNYGYQYKYDITINGDANTYYPVVLRGGNQYAMREIYVFRSYSEKAPAEWNGHPSSKGITLILKLKCNFGNWGGTDYSWWIHDFEETYGNLFASAGVCMSGMGFYIYLRGGGDTGAIYHIYSDQVLEVTMNHGTSPSVYYNSDLIGWSGGTSDNPKNSWNAPAPRTLTDAIKNEIASKKYLDVISKTETRVTAAETAIEKNAEDITLSATKTEVKEVKNQFISQGENLVTNGTAMLGTNYNFSGFTYDGVDTYYSGGSFKYSWTGAVSYRQRGNDYFMPVNVSNAYELSYWIKANNADISFWDMLMMYDIDKNIITSDYVKWIEGSTTTLAQDLKDGDTVVYLTNVAGFNTTTTDSYERGLIFWNYTNSKGYTYPTETYSRNRWESLWSDGSAINTTNNTITLSSPWSNGTFSAGTSVSQCTSGTTYTYLNDTFKLPVNTWTYNSGTVQGVGKNGEANKFREGTAFISIQWMFWYGGTETCEFRLSNVSLTAKAGISDLNDTKNDITTLSKTVTEYTSTIQTNINSITASVEKLETTVTNGLDDIKDDIETVRKKVDLQLTEDQVDIQIEEKLQNGVNKVKTSTGFTFDNNGLNISKSDSKTNTQITEDGMYVNNTETGDNMLTANKDGVNAVNLHATTYLIIGTNSRFEDYSSGGTTKDRTACFWIGE